MNKKHKLKKILEALSPSVEFQQFDESVNKLKSELKDKIHAKTLDDVNTQLERFRKRIDLTPLVDAVGSLETATNDKIRTVADLLAQEIESLRQLASEDRATYEREVPPIAGNIQALREELASLTIQKEKDAVEMHQHMQECSDFKEKTDAQFTKIQERIDENEGDEVVLASELNEEIEQVRTELNNRINTIRGSFGGGNANRNIAIGGNTSVLSTFTDINLKPGANVTISYSKNQTTKYTDVTIAATGGAGTSREISTVAVSSVLADTAATDIVVLASAGIRLTLPTAVGNNNLYTIKNVGSSSVLISTTGGETIDTAPNLIMPVQFTSVDLISDNSNWNLT